jgi:predicted permease
MTWWRRFFTRRRLDEQLDKELRFHLEQHAADLIANGHDPAEARRMARLDLGGVQQIKEDVRDTRRLGWLEDLWRDAAYALRALRMQPAFAAVALVTLALGSGVATLMFTVVNGVLLTPMPYAHPDKLVRLQEQTDYSTPGGNLWAFSYPNFLDCVQGSKSLDLAAFRYSGGILSHPGDAEYVEGYEVSAALLPLLGVSPIEGRTFTSDDDRPGAMPVAIVSDRVWARDFGRNPSAIGAAIAFDGKPYTVVGVLPAQFRIGPDSDDVFVPLGQNTSPVLKNRGAHAGFQVWGRLRPHAVLAAAQAELSATGRALAGEFPNTNKGRTFIANPLRPDVADVRSTLWLLQGAVILVLLVACANIASLLLARAISRERELAMRVALGAGRGRLVRQCLTESAVLSIGGATLGLLVANVGRGPFAAMWPGTLPRIDDVRVGSNVLLFSLGLSIVCGLLFGVAPAFRVHRRAMDHALRSSGRAIAGGSRRLHGAFVVAELALAVVLLISAGMLGGTLLNLSTVDLGVDVHRVLTARAALSPTTLADPARTRVVWDDILDRVRHVPGVDAVATVDTVPLREGRNEIGYKTSAADVPADRQPLVLATSVSPEYLKVMGITLQAGRFFTDRDRRDSQPVAVIDDVMARQAFPDQSPIGKPLWIGFDRDPAIVVGVVNHVKYWGPAGDERASVRAEMYYPFAQVPDNLVRRWSQLMSIAIRTSGDPGPLLDAIRREVRGPSNDQVIYEINTLEDLAGAAIARQRFLFVLFGIFAALALVLACVGIYGVLAYLTDQRAPEIGVRIALGASRAEVVWMVLRQSLGMIAMGLAFGIAGAIAAGRIFAAYVDGMQPSGPLTFFLMTIVLVATALLASAMPARRAGRVDPVKVLRQA